MQIPKPNIFHDPQVCQECNFALMEPIKQFFTLSLPCSIVGVLSLLNISRFLLQSRSLSNSFSIFLAKMFSLISHKSFANAYLKTKTKNNEGLNELYFITTDTFGKSWIKHLSFMIWYINLSFLTSSYSSHGPINTVHAPL